jgi:hypothetical protein
MIQPGINNPTFRSMLDATLATLTLDPTRNVEDLKTEREAATAELAALQPRDATDAAFAARAVATHHAAMECFRRAAVPGLSDDVAMRLLNRAAALSRLSMQTVQLLEQRTGVVRGARAAAAVNPVAAAAAARGGQQPMPSERPASAASPAAGPAAGGRTQHPMHQSTFRCDSRAGGPTPRHSGPDQAGARPAAQPAARRNTGPALTLEEMAALVGLPFP